MTAREIIEKLELLPHPEGGFYKEVYRSTGRIAAAALRASFNGERNFSTSIYFLLQQGDYSAFHRIKSDELWHFYTVVHCLFTCTVSPGFDFRDFEMAKQEKLLKSFSEHQERIKRLCR